MMKNSIKKIFQNLKYFDWHLYFVLIFVALFPAILQTVRTYFLSSAIDVSEFDILGQMEWFDLFNECIIAMLIIPLYSILNTFLKNDSDLFPKQVFKAGITVFIIYGAFSGIMYAYAKNMVRFMNPDEFKIDQIVSYLNMETIAFVLGIIIQFANVCFIILGKTQNFYIYTILNSILLIFTDYLLIPNHGVNGVAYSNIAINGVLAIVMIVLLVSEHKIQPSWFDKKDKKMYSDWAKIGSASLFQSVLDNLIYILMVVKMVNSASSAGNYWIANNFIWLWLLIPVTALAEIIRKDCINGYNGLKQSNYYTILCFIFIIWFCLIPSWKPFFQNVEKLENYSEIYDITFKLFWFYIAYALSVVPDNIFIGLGKTKYSFLNSFVVNVIYYGIFYLAYVTTGFKMTIDIIIMMFGFGMLVHLIVSLLEEKILLVKELRNSNNKEENNLFIKGG